MATIEEQMQMRCRHFTGVQNGECEKGVKYMSIRHLPPEGGMAKWPCTDPGIRHQCALWEPHTKQEIEEAEQRALDFIKLMKEFSERKTEDCLRCGKHVESLFVAVPCVYAYPCSCRLWQGGIPDAWLEAPCTHEEDRLMMDGTIRCVECGEVLEAL